MTAAHEMNTSSHESEAVKHDDNSKSHEERRVVICAELGKMAPVGEVVVDYWVAGPAYCSPVRGSIHVRTRAQGDIELQGHTLHPSQSREAIDDVTIFDDLNKLADQWRKEHVPQENPVYHDK